jgi:hypothetical protein
MSTSVVMVRRWPPRAGPNALLCPSLAAVATELAGHRAGTGRRALHRYLVDRLPMDAVTAVETAPVPRTLKAAGPLTTPAIRVPGQ